MKNSQTALSITTQLLRDPLHPFPCYRELREHYPVYYVEHIPLQPVASAFVYGVKHLPMTFQVEG